MAGTSASARSRALCTTSSELPTSAPPGSAPVRLRSRRRSVASVTATPTPVRAPSGSRIAKQVSGSIRLEPAERHRYSAPAVDVPPSTIRASAARTVPSLPLPASSAGQSAAALSGRSSSKAGLLRIRRRLVSNSARGIRSCSNRARASAESPSQAAGGRAGTATTSDQGTPASSRRSTSSSAPLRCRSRARWTEASPERGAGAGPDAGAGPGPGAASSSRAGRPMTSPSLRPSSSAAALDHQTIRPASSTRAAAAPASGALDDGAVGIRGFT